MSLPETKHQPTGSLGQRARKGAIWIFAGALVSNLMRLGSNLVMTRLLVPEAFGMIALASTILTAINLSTDMGIRRSITRETDGASDHFLRVAWVIKILRSAMVSGAILVVALLMWLLAPGWAPKGTIYAQPVMPGVVALIALAPMMRGMGSTSWELAQRNIDRRTLVFWNVIPHFFSIVAMISFAQISPTVWALMSGMLTSYLLQSVATHLFVAGPRMAFVWDREIADRLWSFGKWIMGASFLGFVSRNVDKFLLGALLSATTFGLYVIAQIWVDAGRSVIRQISDGVGFPVIAETARTRPDDLPRLYRRFQYRIDALCIAACFAAVVCGPYVIGLLYTETYATAAEILQLMGFGFLTLRFNTLGNLVLTDGNSRAMLNVSIILACASVCLISTGFWLFGLSGAVLGTVLTPMSSLPYLLYVARPLLGPREVRTDTIWGLAVLATVCIGYMVITGVGLGDPAG